jgi:hypothetical protein
LNLRLKAISLYLPDAIKTWKFHELVNTTATAFGVEPPDLRSLSFAEALQAYASFTRDEALRWNDNSDRRSQIKSRLFECGRQIGTGLRRLLGVRTRQDVIDAARVLYRLLGIDFRPYDGNGFIIKQCFFSKFYTVDVCRVMSSMDEGLIAGLSDGAGLQFSDMMSEGQDVCLGTITYKGTINEAGDRGWHRRWWRDRG